MKKTSKNKLLYIFVFLSFLLLLILIVPTKKKLIDTSINNKLKLFERNYESSVNLNIYLINYYSLKKNLNKRLKTDYYILLNINLPGISENKVFYENFNIEKLNYKNLKDYENLLISKNCSKIIDNLYIKKNYKLIKILENYCFFEKK